MTTTKHSTATASAGSPPDSTCGDAGSAAGADVIRALGWLLCRVPRKRLFLACLLLSQAATGIAPWLLGRFVDGLGARASLREVGVPLGGLVVCGLGAVLFRGLFERRFRAALRGVECRLRIEIWDTLESLSLRSLDELPQGVVLSKLLHDATMVTQAIQPLIRVGLAALVVGGIAVAVVAAKTPLVALSLAAVFPLAYGLLRMQAGRLRQANRRFHLQIERLSDVLSQQLAMLPYLRAVAASADTRSIVDDEFTGNRAAGEALDTAATDLELRVAGLFACVQNAVLAVCGWLAWKGLLSVGDVVVYYMIYVYALGAFVQTISLLPTLRTVTESCTSLQELFDRREQGCDAGRIRLSRIRDGVCIRHVDFRYGQAGANILRGVSLAVGPGEAVAVVGPSGTGKTTLARLLMGYYEPTGGVIDVDGHDLRTIDRNSLRRRIALVPQDVTLFHGTIRDNITLLSPNVSEEDLTRAVTIAGLDAVFRRHAAGLETVVGPGGVELSGGERQRVAIARAVVRDADLVILDEMAHRLDAAARRGILRNIRTYCESRSVVVITHQPEMLDLVDDVYLLDGAALTRIDRRDALRDMTGPMHEPCDRAAAMDCDSPDAALR